MARELRRRDSIVPFLRRYMSVSDAGANRSRRLPHLHSKSDLICSNLLLNEIYFRKYDIIDFDFVEYFSLSNTKVQVLSKV